MYVTYRAMVTLTCQTQCQRTKKLWLGHRAISQPYQSHIMNPINLILRSKVDVESGSGIHATHPLMVRDACAKYGKPMSNQKIVKGRTRKHVENPVKLTSRSKVNVALGSQMYVSQMYVIHRLMMIHSCAKYGKAMSTPPPPQSNLCCC